MPLDLRQGLGRELGELPHRRLFVGFSGGLDSTVLLHIAQALEADVQALHVNHGLHPEAQAWESHCAAFCGRLGTGFLSRRVRVCGGGEAGARQARYAVFEAVLEADDLLLLGHHRDDQAETVLLRLVQGRAPLAMPRIRRLPNGARILRPWLAIPREELLRYAQRAGLTWIEDHTNTQVDLDRNFLRQVILPKLTERWPGVTSALATGGETQLARDALLAYLRDSDSAFAHATDSTERKLGYKIQQGISGSAATHATDDTPDGLAGGAGTDPSREIDLKQFPEESRVAAPHLPDGLAGDGGTDSSREIDLKQFSRERRAAAPHLPDGLAGGGGTDPPREIDLKQFPRELRVAVLRLWLHGLGEFGVSDRALGEFVRQLDAPADAHPRLPLRQGALVRQGSNVHYIQQNYALQSSYCLDLPGVLKLPHGELVAQADATGFHATGALEVKFRQGGERLRRGGKTGSVKKLLHRAGIPPWQRHTWPLIYAGDELLAIPGIATADSPDREPRWRVSWRPASPSA